MPEAGSASLEGARIEHHPFEFLTVERVTSAVALATLARPERLNAINTKLFGELGVLAGLAPADRELRCLVLTGSGRGFCAGGDFDTLGSISAGSLAETADGLARAFAAIAAFHKIPQPVIAAVNGPAAGGGLALALGCDIRLASPAAVFVAPFLELGITGCDVGLSWLLPRAIGLGRAAEMLLTCRRVDACEAERIGLVNRVVEADALLDEAFALAERIAGYSRLATTMTKEALRLGVDAPSLEAAMALEHRQQALTLQADELGRLQELR